jgi:hypothetical protein
VAYGLYHRVFDQIDANHDGRIDPYELQQYRSNSQIDLGFGK